MKQFLAIMSFIRPYRKSMIISFSLLIISSALLLVQPKLTEAAIDRAIGSGQIPQALLYAALILGSALLAAFVNYSSGVLLIRASQNMSYDLRGAIFEKISSFSFSDFDTWRTGELIVRVNSDVNTVRMFIRMGLFMFIQSLIMLSGSLGAMYMINTQLARTMSLIMPAILLFFFVSARFIRPVFEKVRKALDQVNNSLQENLAGAKLVRAFSRQEEEKRKFEKRNTDFYSISRKVSMVVGTLMPLLMFFGNVAVVIIMIRGGSHVASGTQGMTLGSLIAFSNYTLTAFFPLIMLGMVLSFLSMALASVNRLHELLSTEPKIREPEDPIHVEECRGEIEFADVSFSYGEGNPVLSHLDVRIEAGSMVGIIGTTGAGKSTLAHLIARFYEPSEGSIRIDGHDIRKLSFDFLRRRVNIALQETLLFSGSIRENITFARPDAEQSLIDAAIEASCAREFIDSFERGDAHQIGERGTGLSGGQRQRIAVARSLIADPDILILDDVTSAVDTSTETRIVENLYAQKRKRTTIIISQKINTVRQADRILVMDSGRIIADGTHQHLLESCEMYREIAKTQNP